MISADLVGCSTARNKGTCDNRLNIRRDALEASPNRVAFEAALGAAVSDELALYAAEQDASLKAALKALGVG